MKRGRKAGAGGKEREGGRREGERGKEGERGRGGGARERNKVILFFNTRTKI